MPKTGHDTGQEQCNSCTGALDDWQLRSKVQGHLFHTTNSNTELHLAACTLIEKALNLYGLHVVTMYLKLCCPMYSQLQWQQPVDLTRYL